MRRETVHLFSGQAFEFGAHNDSVTFEDLLMDAAPFTFDARTFAARYDLYRKDRVRPWCWLLGSLVWRGLFISWFGLDKVCDFMIPYSALKRFAIRRDERAGQSRDAL